MHEFNYIDLSGFLAAILTTIAFLPQLYKTWKTKSAEDVSLIMSFKNGSQATINYLSKGNYNYPKEHLQGVVPT